MTSRTENDAGGAKSAVIRFRQAFGRVRFLFALLACLALGYFYGEHYSKSFDQVVGDALPNLIAALAAFIFLWLLYSFLTISPTMEAEDRLHDHEELILKEIRKVQASGLEATRTAQRETVARLLKARPAGVLEVFPVWTEMTTNDWQRLLGGVEDVDIVMNFCDTLIEGFGPTFRSVFDRGGRIRLWLPDPSDAEPIDRLVRLYGGPREEIARRIVNSAVHLDWLRKKSEHTKARAEIRLMQEMLTSPLIRLDRTRVLLSHYDQFYEGHPNAMAVLLDLTESPKMLTYWGDQFKEFTSRGTVHPDLLRERARWAFPAQ